MSDFLFGKEQSGTPVETRGGTSALARELEKFITGGGGRFGELGARTGATQQSILGFDPTRVGFEEAATSALADPMDSLRGLFRAVDDLRAIEEERQVAGLRESFGTLGGRFSENLLGGEGQLRSELGARALADKERALLQAGQQRTSALGTIGALGAQARSQAFTEEFSPFQLAAQFLAPGAPQRTEGALPGILGAGGNIASLFLLKDLLNPGGTGDTGTTGSTGGGGSTAAKLGLTALQLIPLIFGEPPVFGGPPAF